MSEANDVVSPVGTGDEADILSQIISQPQETKAVEPKEGGCLNCANQGKDNKLNDAGECATCGYKSPIVTNG